MESACSLPAAPGDCDGAFEKFYYDPTDGNCKTFLWGGCGEYPFDTLEDCEAGCNCE